MDSSTAYCLLPPFARRPGHPHSLALTWLLLGTQLSLKEKERQRQRGGESGFTRRLCPSPGPLPLLSFTQIFPPACHFLAFKPRLFPAPLPGPSAPLEWAPPDREAPGLEPTAPGEARTLPFWFLGHSPPSRFFSSLLPCASFPGSTEVLPTHTLFLYHHSLLPLPLPPTFTYFLLFLHLGPALKEPGPSGARPPPQRGLRLWGPGAGPLREGQKADTPRPVPPPPPLPCRLQPLASRREAGTNRGPESGGEGKEVGRNFPSPP